MPTNPFQNRLWPYVLTALLGGSVLLGGCMALLLLNNAMFSLPMLLFYLFSMVLCTACCWVLRRFAWQPAAVLLGFVLLSGVVFQMLSEQAVLGSWLLRFAPICIYAGIWGAFWAQRANRRAQEPQASIYLAVLAFLALLLVSAGSGYYFGSIAVVVVIDAILLGIIGVGAYALCRKWERATFLPAFWVGLCTLYGLWTDALDAIAAGSAGVMLWLSLAVFVLSIAVPAIVAMIFRKKNPS